tara:strand:+ start:8426 stop:9202 length:777 start_codon:yes stop_codon:yes gene_type:complete
MAAATSIITAGAALVGTALSISQASKQNQLAKDASKAADAAFKNAEAQLDVNYFEQLGISKEPYNNEREAIAQAAAQAMEVGKESERGGAATAGRVLAQSNIAQSGITDKQIKDLDTLKNLVATEGSSLAKERSTLGLAQAEGAGIAEANARNAQNLAIMQGVQGLTDAGLSIYENSELYKQNNTTPTVTPTVTPPVTPTVTPPLTPQTPTLAQQFQNTSAMFNLKHPQLINQNMLQAPQLNTAYNTRPLQYNPFNIY